MKKKILKKTIKDRPEIVIFTILCIIFIIISFILKAYLITALYVFLSFWGIKIIIKRYRQLASQTNI